MPSAWASMQSVFSSRFPMGRNSVFVPLKGRILFLPSGGCSGSHSEFAERCWPVSSGRRSCWETLLRFGRCGNGRCVNLWYAPFFPCLYQHGDHLGYFFHHICSFFKFRASKLQCGDSDLQVFSIDSFKYFRLWNNVGIIRFSCLSVVSLKAQTSEANAD